jgi:hypothetical protein
MRLALDAILSRYDCAKALRQPMRSEVSLHPRPPRRGRQAKRQRQLIQRIHQLRRARLQRRDALSDVRPRAADEIIQRKIIAVIAFQLKIVGLAMHPHQRKELRIAHRHAHLGARGEVRFFHQRFGIDQRAVEIEDDGFGLTR